MPAPPAPASVVNRDNHFNFLRLLLATLVLLAHAPELTDGDRRREPLTRLFSTLSCGELAVAGFFLLSGFLIVQSWQRRPTLTDFLRARVLRIYPGFVVAALLSVVVVGAVGASHPGGYLARIQPLTLLPELALLHSPDTPPTFPGQPGACVNGNLWTISYEFACYLCAGLLGAGGLLKRRRAFLASTLGVAGVWLLPLAGRVMIVFCAQHFGIDSARLVALALLLCQENAVFTHLLMVFCAGGCFALFQDRVRFSPRWALVALVATVPCLFSLVGSQIALTTLGAYAFFTFAFARIPALAVFQGHTDISYGVYLYGWPVQKLLLWAMPAMSPWTLFALSAVASAGAGWASWQLVERPFLRLKNRVAPAAPVKFLLDAPSAKPA